MAAKKKSSRGTTKAQRKPRTQRGRRPRIRIVVAEPNEMPPADVAKPAAEKLVKVNSAVVRRRQKARAAVAAAPTKAVPTPARTTSKAAKAGTKRHGSASEFVREQPIDMPSREVVARAAKVGLNFSQGLVRVIRFHMRHGRDGESAAVGRGAVRRGRPPKSLGTAGVRRGRPPAAARAAAARSSAEVEFRRLVVELGTGRAKALVVEVERAIEALISG